jgi:hypothetical protein
MSPASYLTAPPRVAAGIIAPARYDRGVSAVLWGALGFFLFVLVVSLVGLALFAWLGWRQFTAVQKGLLTRLEALGESVAAVEGRVGAAEARTADLQREIARLSRSLAQARVLVGALGEVGDIAGRVRGVVPSK